MQHEAAVILSAGEDVQVECPTRVVCEVLWREQTVTHSH